MQEQSQKQLKLGPHQRDAAINQLDTVQDQPCILSKILCLHHIATVGHYLSKGVSNTSLLKYKSSYEKFIKTSRVRDLAIKQYQNNKPFNLFTSILSTQTCSIILVILLSILTAIASIVIIFYQKQLIRNILNEITIDSWKFFSVIVVLIVGRLLVFNYLITLSNNIALNIRVNLQNFYMRAIFMVDNEDLHTKINKFRYLAIEQITDGVVFFPFMVSSLFIVLGVIVLVFLLDPLYGAITLAIFSLFLIILLLVCLLTYKGMLLRSDKRADIIKQSKYTFEELIKMFHQNIISKLIDSHLEKKEQKLQEEKGINITYGLLQVLSDSSILVPIIIFYGIYHKTLDTQIIQNVYLSAIYLSIIYFPVKLIVYGSFYILYAVANYQGLLNDINLYNKKRTKDLNKNISSINYHSYAQDIGECFEYEYQLFEMEQMVSKRTIIQREGTVQMKKKISSTPNIDKLPLSAGKNAIVLCSYTVAQTKMFEFLQSIKKQISRDKKYAFLDQSFFLVPASVSQNVRLYDQPSVQNNKEIRRVLELVGLEQFIGTVDSQQFIVSQSLGRIYSWHTSRLELARALYHNVDYLIIDRFNLIQDTDLMSLIISQRNKKNQITIMVNRSNFQLLKLSSSIILSIQHEPYLEINTYENIKKKQSEKWMKIYHRLLEEQIMIKHDKENRVEQYLQINMKDPTELTFQNGAYGQFLGSVHPGAMLVVIVILGVPCALKLYIAYLIGLTLKQQIFNRLLGYGLGYLASVLLRQIVLANYLKSASLALYKKMIQKLTSLNCLEIIERYRNYDSTTEYSFEDIDNHFLMSFELGVTGFLEGIIGIVILAIGYPLILSVGVPVLLVTLLTTFIKIRLSRTLYALRQKHMRILNNYVQSCTVNSQRLLGYHRYSSVLDYFYSLNNYSVIYTANEMWILSGMRIIGEIILTIGLVLFLVAMIIKDITPGDKTMVSLGVSLFLNVNMTYRFSIQTTTYLQRQMLALTKIARIIAGPKATQEDIQNEISKDIEDKNGQQTKQKVTLNKLQYKNVSVNIGDLTVSNINFIINKRQRIAVGYDTINMANAVFWALSPKIITSQQFKGQIIVNQNIPFKESQLKICYLLSHPFKPKQGTIFHFFHILNPQLAKADLQKQMTQFFTKIGITPLFTPDTPLEDLPLSYQQILNIFRCTHIQSYDIVVNTNGLDCVNIITRKVLEEYLIESQIPVVVSISNMQSISQLYPKKFMLRDLVLEVRQDQELLQEYKRIRSAF